MENIEDLRSGMRRIDDGIMELIGERLKISEKMGVIKAAAGKGVRDVAVERTTLERFRALADMVGLSPEAAEDICRILTEQSIGIQASVPRGSSKRKSIAIIGGHGQMGRMMQRLLGRSDHEIVIIDPAAKNGRSLGDAADADIVIVSVPISSVSGVLRDLDGICREDALIFDISSLKSPFLHVLKDMASRRRVCSVHPMFGPSVRSMHGRNLIVCDCGSDEAANMAVELMKDQGADIRVIPVDQHDMYMSYVLGLSHIVNIAFFTVLERSGISFGEMCSVASTTFDKMIDTNMSVALEDPHLYYEIQHLNVNRNKMLSELGDAIRAVSDAALSDDSEEFSNLMLRGRSYLEE
ncbi:MAG: prephenate dehydrogenase/arogenate dehydrogenase family protein [Methanomassiliicoccaceae archaeon]|nr:prephenate dehydrogenase/arogenate dehydrogenase family protein [Methanomassiliicoccaceae archaeon]